MSIRLPFSRLSQLRAGCIDQALAAALPTVSRREIAPIARLLLSRGDASALATLIQRFEHLPEDLQAQLVGQIDDLHGACREAAKNRGSAGPKVVIELVRQTRSFKLVYLVAEQLRTGPIELRRAAAQCLLDLTEHFITEQSEAQPTGITSESEGRDELQSAVEEGLLLYQHHHQPEILLAFAMLLPGPCDKAMVALRDPRQSAVQGLRQLILDGHEIAIVRHSLRWLSVATLQGVVLSVLPRLCRAGKLSLILEQGDLLLQSATRQALGRVNDPAALLPGEVEIQSMQEVCAKWLPHWITALPLDGATRIHQLARLSASPHASTRTSALQALIEKQSKFSDGSPDADEGLHNAIAEFCFDPSEEIALAATNHLIAINWPGLHRLLVKLNQDGAHPALRTLASDILAPLGFEGLWRHWPRLKHEQRMAATKALIKLDDHFHRMLDERLASDDIPTQLRALDMIASLNQGPLYEELLPGLARDENEKVAASAVRALASCTGTDASNTLEASLAHSSARVRANAVEAMDLHRISRSIAQVRQMAANEANRPRANAIAKLLHAKDEDAASHLRTMLGDAKPNHRISALWAAEHEGRIDVVADIAEMVISDEDANVRNRAGQTLKQLLAKMQVKTVMPIANDTTSKTSATLEPIAS